MSFIRNLVFLLASFEEYLWENIMNKFTKSIVGGEFIHT
jgi:hypothetical protein